MSDPIAHLPDAEAREVRALVLRHFFGTTVGVALVGVVMFCFVPAGMTGPGRASVVGGFGVLAALAAWGLRSPMEQRFRPMLAVSSWAVGLIAYCACLQGTHAHAPGLIFLGLIVCMVAAVAPARHAYGLAAVAMVAAAWLSWLEAQVPSVELTALVQRAITLAMAVLTGLAAGLAMARVGAAHVVAAGERERRFRTLLGIAVTAYWETDEHLRLRQLLRRTDDGGFEPVPVAPGSRAADMTDLQFDDQGPLVAVRSAMQRREPFRNLPARWHGVRGTRQLLISGEPHHDSRGRFDGYWGVASDVTDEMRAQQDLAQSQALLTQAMSASPDVITLTDLASGRYEMVNERFTEISGYRAEQVLGKTAAELGMWVDPVGRQALLDAVAATGQVRDLPLKYRVADGSIVLMQVSARRLEHGGRAWLVVNARDVTEAERHRLEREALLTHAPVGLLFARRGVIESANAQAERVFGCPRGGMVGLRTVDLLADPQQADRIRAEQQARFARAEVLGMDMDLRRLDDGQVFTAMVRASPLDPRHPMEGTVWIFQDITERRRMEAALAAARDQAEAANRAKSAFLANTSHEIRTPLHGLLGLAQLARQPDLPEPKRRQYLDQIADSAHNLSAIISDILDLSKIEAGKLEVELVVFDLHELLHSLHRAYAALAAAQDLDCELRLAPGLPTLVRGDPLRLRQVLANFLNNALKFTARGRVDIEAAPQGADRVRISVIDTGTGIAGEAQARLFRPFTQADESTTRRFGGTGLGLSICRELATLMGGEVGLASEPGQGSRFHILLPLPPGQPDDPGSGFGALDGDRLAGARVLLVEDNAVNMLIAVAMLEQWGVHVTQAEHGEAALAAVDAAAARGLLFDAVLMDVQMPGLSGYDATRMLRRRFGPQALPVIALTAAALVSEREAAAAAGMTDFVTKPIDASRLRRALLQAISR